MVGPPGAGKSMLAARLSTILPPLPPAKLLKVSMIASVAGEIDGGALTNRRPFRAPHHSASMPALVGGGLRAGPGGCMKGTHSVTLITLIVAVSAAAGSSFFAGQNIDHCFITGGAGYRVADYGPANYTVRIDNVAPQPGLHLQVVDDPVTADFMLIDDSASASGCHDAATVDSIRINAGGAGGADPDLTVSLSREPAEHRIYVRSANFSERDAAALFAVIWRNAQNGKSPAHKIARRD